MARRSGGECDPRLQWLRAKSGLLVAKCFDRVHLRRLERGEESRENADHAEDHERHQNDHGRGAQEDVAFVVGRFVELAVEGHWRNDPGEEHGDEYADQPTGERQHECLQQELHQNVTRPCAERFPKADLTGAFRLD